MSTVLVGLDIGFGNTKIAHQIGEPGPVQLHRFASGACPLDVLPVAMDGSRNLCGGRRVLVHGEDWVAGLDSHYMSGYTRPLSDDYTRTTDWLALAHAALVHIGQRRITCLVAGLPVSEFYTPGRREAVVERLQAVHRVGAEATVEVQQVVVVPQPLGAYGAWFTQHEVARGRPMDRDAMVLVIDPGHYSVDWVLMQGSLIRRQSSHSSTLAGSELLRRASVLLKERHGRTVTVDRLEARVRRDDLKMDISEEIQIDLAEILQEAALQVVDAVIRDVRASLKSVTEALYGVVVAGGGAPIYAPAVAAAFPDVKVYRLPDSIMANAVGFLQFARHLRTQQAA
jgi:plasmid segregation protein ParM